MLSRATLKMMSHPCVFESRESFRQQKRPRPRFGVAAGSRNFMRLLVAQFTRARFAGPLPPKEEAVSKGEISISDVHGAV
jgi:hypothetical protein